MSCAELPQRLPAPGSASFAEGAACGCGRERGRRVHLAMDTAMSDIRAVEFTPSSDGNSPVLPELLDQIPGGDVIGPVAGQRTAPMTRNDATRPSLTAMPQRSSRSARTADRGKRTAQPQSPETKPCAQPGTTVGLSGSAGQDTTSKVGSRRRCGASRPSETASPQDTPTARQPKSGSVSH